MKTVREVSQMTGVSVRTLHHYHAIGLLVPAQITEAGYRLYDDKNLERLQMILLFREFQFPLKEIRRILDSPDFDRNRALEKQIALLEMQREHLDNVLTFAKGILGLGVRFMDFSAFDTKKLDEYSRKAKEMWGKTEEWREFEEKEKRRAPGDDRLLGEAMMQIFVQLGQIREKDPACEEAQALVGQLQAFITEHFYTCTDKILAGLGKMYSGGGSMTENIDEAGGSGTAVFADKAIEIYTAKRKK